MDYALQLFKMILILAVFAAGAYFFRKKIKRRQLNKTSPNGMIQVIDGVQIGMKEEVVLMKIGTEYILLAMGSGNMLALSQTEIASPKENFDEVFAKQNPTIALKSVAKTIKDKWVNR